MSNLLRCEGNNTVMSIKKTTNTSTNALVFHDSSNTIQSIIECAGSSGATTNSSTVENYSLLLGTHSSNTSPVNIVVGSNIKLKITNTLLYDGSRPLIGSDASPTFGNNCKFRTFYYSGAFSSSTTITSTETGQHTGMTLNTTYGYTSSNSNCIISIDAIYQSLSAGLYVLSWTSDETLNLMLNGCPFVRTGYGTEDFPIYIRDGILEIKGMTKNESNTGGFSFSLKLLSSLSY